jgi:hypothetical protein
MRDVAQLHDRLCYTFKVIAVPHARLLPQKAAAVTRKCGFLNFAAILALVFMPLSPPTSRRGLKHTRAIEVEAFARDDGLWDLDAHITDIRAQDAALTSGIRPAGMPIHDLWLRITIDTLLTIVDAEAVSAAVPFPGFCQTIGPDYKKLIGLSLIRGFRQRLQERLSGIHGCTHLTELALVLPTAAIQALAGELSRPTPIHSRPLVDSSNKEGNDVTSTSTSTVSNESKVGNNSNNEQSSKQGGRPFQIDRCHAMRSDGAAVAQYYPRWAVKPPSGSQPG